MPHQYLFYIPFLNDICPPVGAEMNTFEWSLGVDPAYAKALRNGAAHGEVQRL